MAMPVLRAGFSGTGEVDPDFEHTFACGARPPGTVGKFVQGMAGRGNEIPRDMASETERSERRKGGNVGAKVRGSGGAGESDIRAEGARDNIDGY